MDVRPSNITDKYGMDKGPVPIRPNIDPEYFELEREKIFKHAWLNVGRVEDVAKPGDFLVKDIDVLQTSVIVVRGRDNKIRAFHNMCKHRGNKVVRTGIEWGNCKGFSCGFHGWTYDLAGKLVIVPDEDQFFDVDKNKNGLTPIEVDVWEGFIFVNNAPRQSLKEHLGVLHDKFTGYFDNANRISWYRADVKVNWKVVIDAFVEGYHAAFLHGKAYPDQINFEGEKLMHLLGCEFYGPHRGISIDMNPSSEPAPVAGTLMKYSPQHVWQDMHHISADLDDLPSGINPTRHENWAFDIYTIFPSFYIAPSRSMHFVTYHFWPVAVDRTIWQTDHFMYTPQNASDRLAQEMSKAFARDVQREDLITLENTQSMLRSGAMDTMVLSDQEAAVRQGYEVVEQIINS